MIGGNVVIDGNIKSVRYLSLTDNGHTVCAAISNCPNLKELCIKWPQGHTYAPIAVLVVPRTVRFLFLDNLAVDRMQIPAENALDALVLKDFTAHRFSEGFLPRKVCLHFNASSSSPELVENPGTLFQNIEVLSIIGGFQRTWDADVVGIFLRCPLIFERAQVFTTNVPLRTPLPLMPRLTTLGIRSVKDMPLVAPSVNRPLEMLHLLTSDGFPEFDGDTSFAGIAKTVMVPFYAHPQYDIFKPCEIQVCSEVDPEKHIWRSQLGYVPQLDVAKG